MLMKASIAFWDKGVLSLEMGNNVMLISDQKAIENTLAL